MHIILDTKSTGSPTPLYDKLISLNQSVKGTLPMMTTQHIDDILKSTTATALLTWNWSKSFNQQ